MKSYFVLMMLICSVAVAQRVTHINGVPVGQLNRTGETDPGARCAEEKSAWEQADAALSVSIIARSKANADLTAAEAEQVTAQQAIDAAIAKVAAATSAIETATSAVSAANTDASDAYAAYLACRVGD